MYNAAAEPASPRSNMFTPLVVVLYVCLFISSPCFHCKCAHAPNSVDDAPVCGGQEAGGTKGIVNYCDHGSQ